MNRHVMIELTQPSDDLHRIDGFEWDREFSIVDNPSSVLVRGIVREETTILKIEALPQFKAIWDDAPIGPAIIDDLESTARTVDENSEKAAFESLLSYHKKQGKNITFYQKWLDKMQGTDTLPKPVYQKLINEFGNRYETTS